MERLADRLDGIHLRVRAPGTEIYGELRHQRDVGITFGQDVYRWTNESTLERALVAVARLLSAGWAREYHAALRAAGLEVFPPPQLRDPEYEQEKSRIEAIGMSANGRVTIVAIGLREFAARIAPGTVRELSEQEFTASVRDAAAAFVASHLAGLRELQRRYVDQRGR
jgi:hypothetical protein